jgi:glutaredoxin
MNARAAARLVAIGLVMACVAPSLACHRASADGASADASTLAPIVVRDDSQGLLLTWIDDKGDFHVEQRTTDVPLVGRDAVRVVDPSRDDGARGDTVYVADLRVAGADGAFPVHMMTREDFDALAVTRRGKTGATLATATADGGARGTPDDNAVAGRPAVIVYGASWCSACHQAEAYFKKKGIVYIEKDIEKDEVAAEEMRSKLKRAGLRGGSIPVIDVRGHIMIGFDPRSIEDALGSPI